MRKLVFHKLTDVGFIKESYLVENVAHFALSARVAAGDVSFAKPPGPTLRKKGPVGKGSSATPTLSPLYLAWKAFGRVEKN